MVARRNKWMVTMFRTLADQGMYDNVKHVTNEKKDTVQSVYDVPRLNCFI